MHNLRIIGENLNSSNASARAIYESNDEDALLESAGRQLEAGAFAVDLNTSMLMGRERDTLLWAARSIREQLDCTVSLDSPDAELLLDIAPEFGKHTILNSFTADRDQIEAALPVIAATGASAVVMLKDKSSVPETAMLRLELASMVSALASEAGVSHERIYLDPILTPIATAPGGLGVCLDTIEALSRNFPNFPSIGGVSNVSFGLPKRRLVNSTFLAMAISRGLDAAICDPTDERIMAVIAASRAIDGSDPGCREFLRLHRRDKR
jgi:5-methyltetrahydrofolate--homocysteine methyltransferase